MKIIIKMYRKYISVIFSLFFIFIESQPSYSQDAESLKAAKELAESIKGSGKMNAGNTDPATAVPGYKGTNVDALKYYEMKKQEIEAAAAKSAVESETGRYYNKAREQRPIYEIDPSTDPMFKRHKEIEEKANKLSETYAGCVDLPYGTADVTKYKSATCKVTGRRDIVTSACNKTLNVTCSNSDAGQPNPMSVDDFIVTGDPVEKSKKGPNTFSFGAGRKGSCSFFTTTIQFYVTSIYEITDFSFSGIAYDDWLDISVNDQLIFRGIGPNQGTNIGGGNWPCEYNAFWNYQGPIDAKPRLRYGWNTIKVVNEVHKGGGMGFSLTISRQKNCTFQYSEDMSCTPTLKAESVKKSSVCTDTTNPRYIKGFPTYKSCWAWQETWEYKSAPIYTREKLCNDLFAQGCSQIGSSCSIQGDGFCQESILSLSCPYQAAANYVSLCGKDLICPDGKCTEEYKDDNTKNATDDFKKAAASLAVADEIAKNFESENINVFNGRSLKCGRNISAGTGGAINCCKDSGWATDAGLARCSTDEKTLGLAKEAGQTVRVGDYKEGTWPDERRYDVFCVFPSKLSRILIAYAKPSLGRSFGSAKNPSCDGIKIHELASIKLDGIDLSELYADVLAKANAGSTPAGGDAETYIKKKVETLKKSGGKG